MTLGETQPDRGTVEPWLSGALLEEGFDRDIRKPWSWSLGLTQAFF